MSDIVNNANELVEELKPENYPPTLMLLVQTLVVPSLVQKEKTKILLFPLRTGHVIGCTIRQEASTLWRHEHCL